MVLHPSVDGLFLLMPVYGCLLNPIKFSAFLIWMTIANCQWTAIGRLAAHQHPHCRRQDRFCKTFYEAAAHWVVKCMHEIDRWNDWHEKSNVKERPSSWAINKRQRVKWTWSCFQLLPDDQGWDASCSDGSKATLYWGDWSYHGSAESVYTLKLTLHSPPRRLITS